MRWHQVILVLALIAAVDSRAAGLERLRYNHPGLTVDLGVGLWAWPVPVDYDGDGDNDLLVVCPDKPSNGTYLFENTSGKGVKLPVFKAARRQGPGGHYTSPSYVDGRWRVLRANTEWPDFLQSGLAQGRDVKLPLPVTAHTNIFSGRSGVFKIRHNVWRYVDFDGDGALDLTQGVEDWSDYGWDNAYDVRGRWTNGPLHGLIYVLRNANTTAAPRYAAPFPLRLADGSVLDNTGGNPAQNFADFDGDGDLDLLCGEFVDSFTYYENTGSRAQPKYAAGRHLRTPDGARLAMELQMIVPVAFDWDGDGDFDLIVGDEDGRVAFVEHTGRLAADRSPLFLPPVYFQQEADELKCGALATPVGFDWDGDGDMDIVSGNTAGFIEFFENLSGPEVAAPKWAAPRRLEVGGKTFRIMAGENRSIQGPVEAKWGYTVLNIADWDGDGRPDVLLNSILGEVVWLKNTGTRRAPKLAAPQAVEVEWEKPQPKLAWGWWAPQGKELLTQWRTTPVVFDFNRDGLPDLAMLDHEGYLAFFERARRGEKLVLLSPRRAFVDAQGQPLRLNAKSAGASGRRKLCVTDWDGDGRFDFLLNSANANFLRQVDARDGKWFFKDLGGLDPRNIEGHDVSPAVVDFNSDGVPDFLGGAEDGRFYFLKNPRAKAQ